MTFANIPHGCSLFLDANTLIYYFAADPTYGAACKQLMERIARREVQGFTSAAVVYDVAHRVMTLEAINQFGWSAQRIAQRLRKKPAEVQKLSRYQQAVNEVPQIGIQVLAIDLALVSTATTLCQQYGLLIGDALIVALMRHHGLTDLASSDSDFDRVPGLTRYAPT